MFQFSELIKVGIESANKVEQNRKDIESVFQTLNTELKNATDGKVSIRVSHHTLGVWTETIKALAIAKSGGDPSLSLDKTPDSGVLELVFCENYKAPIARWEQHSDGYPFTITFLEERADCWDQESLANILGKLVSSGQFWLKVKELETKSQKSPEDDNKVDDTAPF